MKKSKSASMRIKRAISELKEKGNGFDIGNFILEQIILQGMIELKNDLKKENFDKSIISPKLYEETLNILNKHIS